MHRHPLGHDPAVHGIGQQPLGTGAAALRRPRRDLDRGRAGGAAVPRRTPMRRWPGSGSSRPARPTSPTSCTPVSSPRRCSAATTAGAASPWSGGCGTTRTAPQWQPGGGGLCLHTVLVHPRRPESAADRHLGGRRLPSDDGGSSWRASNRGIVVGFVPEGEDLEFGQCVHKVARDAGDPERLYLQHHGGIYRSDDGGDTGRR